MSVKLPSLATSQTDRGKREFPSDTNEKLRNLSPILESKAQQSMLNSQNTKFKDLLHMSTKNQTDEM